MPAKVRVTFFEEDSNMTGFIPSWTSYLSSAGAGALTALLLVSPASDPRQDRVAHWQQDIDATLESLFTKHKNAFHTTPRKDIQKAADELKAKVGQLADYEVTVGLMRLVALIGDAHTNLQFNTLKWHVLPIDIEWLRDGVFIAKADQDHRDLLGARVLGLGNLTVEDAATRAASVTARENDQWSKVMAKQWIRYAEVLRATGIIDSLDAAPLTLLGADGAKRTLVLKPTPATKKFQWITLPDAEFKDLTATRKPRDGGRWYGHSFDAASGTLYCWYDRCQNQPDKPTVGTWAKEVLGLLDEHDVQRVVIDLRRNGGGNSILLSPLIGGLARREKINQDGKIFVLIDRHTFSSAEMNAGELKRGTKAVLVGEPTGGKPNGYGEVRTFNLPNSGLTVQYSTRYFKVEDMDRPSQMPDVNVEPTAAEFFAGRDVMMEAVMRYRAK
jgi:Peptidase family S41